MMLYTLSVFIIITLRCISGARILAVSPMPALSHFALMEPLFEELGRLGHNVTVLSHHSPAHSNYKFIDLRGTVPRYELDCETYDNVYSDFYEFISLGATVCDKVLGSNIIQNFLQSQQTFDLIFIESFDCDALLGFPLLYKAPFIAYSSLGLSTWLSDWFANPTEPSFVPDHWCRESGISMLERSRRLACQMILRTLHWWFTSESAVDSVRRNFKLNISSLDEIKSNASALFVNVIPAVSGNRPLFTNIVELGGMHIKPPKPLPTDLKTWMDGCENGVVVFSMGSIVRASTLHPSIREAIVAVFKELKECVLWKWEEELKDLPSRIKTVSWLPQADALAHKNVKLFIAHGGVHGLMETIKVGVPVLGMPLYGDQMTNLQLLQEAGAAISMPLQPFHQETFNSSIRNILHNQSFQDNTRRLSKIMNDVDRTPLERAVWWTEYVLRHHGAPHLRNKGQLLNFWQRRYLDIVFVIMLTLLLGYKFITVIWGNRKVR